MTDFSELDRFLQDNRQSHVEQLFELLRIASISADSSKGAEMAQAAGWVEEKFASGGLKTQQILGDGPPLVYLHDSLGNVGWLPSSARPFLATMK